MSQWTIQHRLISPVRAFPDRLLPGSVELRIQLAPTREAPLGAEAILPDDWRLRLAAAGVCLASEPRLELAPKLPFPWCAAPLPVAQLLGAELGRSLCLSPPGLTDPALGWPAPDHQTLTEALALALVRLAPLLDFRSDLLRQWQADFAAMMFERSQQPIRVRRSDFALLAQAYRLLDLIIGLRTGIPTLADAERALARLQEADSLPLAFRILFGAESVHRQAQATAAALKDALPGMADEVDVCLLGLQHGRLAYYQGNFPLALRCFLLEWKNLSREKIDRPAHLNVHEARLLREAANVFSDLGCLPAAEELIRRAVQQQAHTDDPERFKSIGRLGEILLRQGLSEEAARCYAESLALQEANDLPLDQTLTYLGHAALQGGKLGAAAEFYARGRSELERQGRRGSSAFLWMGEIALALAKDDQAGLQVLAANYGEHQPLRGPRVLPRAVGATGLWQAGLLVAVSDVHGQLL